MSRRALKAAGPETMRFVSRSVGTRRAGASSVAKLGLAGWLFGNLYEGVVGMPQLLNYARGERPPGVLTPGSPARYFVLLAPAALTATGLSIVQDWRLGEDRRPVAARAVCVVGALAVSGYLIRFINLPLLEHEPVTESTRSRLIATWHKLNAVRIVLVGIGFALQPSR